MTSSSFSSRAIVFYLFSALGLVVTLLGGLLFASRRQIYYTWNPSEWKPHTKAFRPDGVLPTCSNVSFADVKTLYNIHDFETAVEIVRIHKAPVLFKKFLPNVEEIWSNIYELKKDAEITFTDIEIKAFGNTFYRGCKHHGTRQATMREVMSSATDSSSNNSLFASFIPFIDREAMEEILPGVPRDRFMLDSNFISNFKEDLVSSAFHAASAVTSYSIQLVGTKMWVFSNPLQMEKYNPITMPATIPSGASEADFFTENKEIPIVVEEAGDMLVFPPHWAHAVISKKGPNVMVNLREFRILDAIKANGFRIFQFVLLKMINRIKNRVEKREIFKRGFVNIPELANDLEKSYNAQHDFEGDLSFTDSGCKDFFIEKMYQ